MRGRFLPALRRRVWDRKEIRYPLTGWLLFIVSAGFFVASRLRNGDPLGLAGALFFMAACFFFLPPLFAEISGREVEEDGRERDEGIQQRTPPRQWRKIQGGPGRMGSGAPETIARHGEFPADDSGDGNSP